MGFGAPWPEIKQSLLLEAANFGEYRGKKEPSILSTIKPKSNKFSGQGQRLGDGDSVIKQKQLHQDRKGWSGKCLHLPLLLTN